jgi:thymidylate kinase
MIAVLQGTPGSGKTTALTQLVRTRPGFAFVPELLVPTNTYDDAYFIANDIAKAQKARTQHGVVLMDRDFTSTLAYVMARDGSDAPTAQHVRTALHEALQAGNLLIPDIFFLFHLPPQLSLLRQQPGNTPEWSNPAFVEKVDEHLHQVVAEYIPRGIICDIDGTASEKTVVRQIAEEIRRIKHEATHTS